METWAWVCEVRCLLGAIFIHEDNVCLCEDVGVVVFKIGKYFCLCCVRFMMVERDVGDCPEHFASGFGGRVPNVGLEHEK